MPETERLTLEVNEQLIEFEEPVRTVNEILIRAGYDPPADHILIQQTPGGADALSSEQLVNIQKTPTIRFWAFQSDRVFRFTVEGASFDWGAGQIAEPTLRKLTGASCDDVLVLKRNQAPNQALASTDTIELSEAGTEHFLVSKKQVTVSIDGIDKQIPSGSYKLLTEDLINVLGVNSGYLLNVVDVNGELKGLADGDTIQVMEGMKFISQVPSGGSA